MLVFERMGQRFLLMAILVFLLTTAMGTGLGAASQRLFVPLQETVSPEEHIILISLLYEREGLLNNAKERLAPLEEKGTERAVAELALGFASLHPERPREVQALARLAKDLELARASAGPTAAAAPDLSWLGTALLVLFLLVVGVSFLMAVARLPWGRMWQGVERRGAGTVSPRLSLPFNDWLERLSSWWGTTAAPLHGQPVVRRRRGSVQELVPVEPEAEQIGFWQPEVVTEAPAPAEAGRLLLSFQSTYRLGQDPYKEVYPILENQTAVLIGACGLSPGVGFDPSTADRFHVMTVWLHDYKSPQALRGAALVSRGLFYGEQPRALEEWLRAQKLDTVLPAEPGRSVVLEAAALRARVAVLEVENEPARNTKGPIAWIAVRFEVSLKKTRPS